MEIELSCNERYSLRAWTSRLTREEEQQFIALYKILAGTSRWNVYGERILLLLLDCLRADIKLDREAIDREYFPQPDPLP